MRLTPVFLCFDVFNTVKASRDFQSHIFISASITLVLLRRAEPRGHQTIVRGEGRLCATEPACFSRLS